MRSKVFRLLGVVSIVIMLFCLMVISQGEAGDEIISSGADLKLLNKVWTLERIKDAKPYPLPAMKGIPPQEKASSGVEQVGQPGLISGGSGNEEFSLPGVLSVEPLGYVYPPPYTRYENFNSTGGTYSGYKAFPYRTVGVLFFTQNGIDYRCSASSIGNYAIWTAGHCVSDGAGNWSYDFLFIPAYKDGSPPISWAQWTGSEAWTIAAWHNSGNLARDMGGVVLNLNITGKKVSTVGWLGFAYNMPRDTHWHQIGYPAGVPFNGNRQIICASSHSKDDPAFTPNTMATGCDMTGGSSGGPWIKNFSGSGGASNYLNGNVSYRYIGYTEEMYSPYFDDVAHNLWDVLVNEVP